MEINGLFGAPPGARELPARKGFRILVLADLGSAKPFGKPRRVDRDDLEDVFRALQVRVPIGEDGSLPAMTIEPKELDDFHPDRLFEQLELFESLRTRRRRLQNDQWFAEEAAAIVDSAEGKTAPDAKVSPDVDPVDGADLLGQAIEQTVQQGPVVEQIAQGELNIEDYVRQVVAPFVLAKPDPRKQEFLEGVDQAITETMRRVLHDSSFRRVESSWLGIQMLVRRLETDSKLTISLLNLSKPDLQSDLLEHEELESSALYKALAAPLDVDEDPWTIVIADYSFAATMEDTQLLGRLAKIHAAVGAVLVAAADPQVAGCESLSHSPDPDGWRPTDDAEQLWQQLRNLPESQSLALVIPKVIARPPYGKSTMPIDAFRFEELDADGAASDYLWLNGAFAVAALLGASYSDAGWNLRVGWSPELGGLPMCVRDEDGESIMQPCAEVELSEKAAKKLSDAGLVVLRSVRNQGSVLLPTLRSLSLENDDLLEQLDR